MGTALVIALCLRDDPPPPDSPDQPVTPRATLDELHEAIRHPVLWLLIAFLMLWNFSPLSMTVIYLHWTQTLGFSEVFYGHTVVWLGVGAMTASLGYGLYCRLVPRVVLMHMAIVLGIVATWAYGLVVDESTAGVVSALVGFTHMTATLILLDMAGQICPVRSAGTVFGVLMSVQNLSVMVAIWLGGQLYDTWLTALRSAERIPYPGGRQRPADRRLLVAASPAQTRNGCHRRSRRGHRPQNRRNDDLTRLMRPAWRRQISPADGRDAEFPHLSRDGRKVNGHGLEGHSLSRHGLERHGLESHRFGGRLAPE